MTLSPVSPKKKLTLGLCLALALLFLLWAPPHAAALRIKPEHWGLLQQMEGTRWSCYFDWQQGAAHLGRLNADTIKAASRFRPQAAAQVSQRIEGKLARLRQAPRKNQARIRKLRRTLRLFQDFHHRCRNFAPPYALSQSHTINQGKELTIRLKGVSHRGRIRSYQLKSNAARGRLFDLAGNQLSVNGLTRIKRRRIRYVPYADYKGRDTFSFSVSAAKAESAAAAVLLTIRPVNNPPLITTDTLTLAVGGDSPALKVFPVVVDPDGDLLSITATGLPSGATINNRGLLSWQPDLSEVGSHYQVNIRAADGQSEQQGIVTIAVRAPQTFYVDPISGSSNGDGSEHKPWRTVSEVLAAGLVEYLTPAEFPFTLGKKLKVQNPGAPIKAGDTLLLRSGYHGEFSMGRAFLTDYISIQADHGHLPQLRRVQLTGATKWRFADLSISAGHAPEFIRPRELVFFDTHGYSGPVQFVIIENCRIFSLWDSSGWSAANWNAASNEALVSSGISSSAAHVAIRSNYLKNINFGISASGNHTIIEHNTIENFAGDGMRFTGHEDALIQYNTVKNCYAVNSNHDDGFQSWGEILYHPVSGERLQVLRAVRSVTLRGNIIINSDNPNQPFRGTLQGIGCFDGPYENWRVENNLVLVQHYHGITLSGAYNSVIINNTAYDVTNEYPAWIRIVNHKDGTPSRNNIVRNNLAGLLSVPEGSDNISDHNLSIAGYRRRAGFVEPEALFIDHLSGDFRPRWGGPAHNGGSCESAPGFDLIGVTRPQGAACDIGAYEATP